MIERETKHVTEAARVDLKVTLITQSGGISLSFVAIYSLSLILKNMKLIGRVLQAEN